MRDIEEKTTDFFLVFCKTRKKLDKYFKINKIRNKQIIDIRKIIDEENINLNNKESQAFFKVLIWNKITTAKEKGKDVYYIPNFQNSKLDVIKLLNINKTLKHSDTNFNLLLFFEEFSGTLWLNDIMSNLDIFENSQIIRNY
jgi:hypothetical protein